MEEQFYMNPVPIIDLPQEKGFEYPAILLSGVEFDETIKAIKYAKSPSNRTFKTWLRLSDGTNNFIGELNLTFDMLMLLRYLKIKVTLYLDADTVHEIDLENPEELEDFI